MTKKKKVLVTGAAGFIGFHLTGRLIIEGYEVVGLDNVNDYYDINLKFARLDQHGIAARQMSDKEFVSSTKYDSYRFLKAELSDHDFIVDTMVNEKFDYVINLAAQAGVRYSIENPRAYSKSNIDGFLSILEGSRASKVAHLIYASTSSVYGLNTKMPLSEDQHTDHPMAYYAATKKANEMMAHSYSHLFRLPTSGLRFFTVYGPWGRPDMALFLFTDAILKNQPIKVFNHGKMIRDFTYVADIVESIACLITKPASPDSNWDGSGGKPNSSSAPYQIFNIGNSSPVNLMEYIEALETSLGKKAQKNFMDIQPGDVPATHADASRLEAYTGFRPKETVQSGVQKFVDWYMSYYS